MILTQFYIAVSIMALAILALLVFFVNKKKENRLSKLAGIAFAFVLTGIFVGDYFSYALMGIGIAIAVIDIIQKSEKKIKNH